MEGLETFYGFFDNGPRESSEEIAHLAPENIASLIDGIEWLSVLIDRQKSINTLFQGTCLIIDSTSDIQKPMTDNPQSVSPDGLLNVYSGKFREFANCINITNEYIDVISSFVQPAK